MKKKLLAIVAVGLSMTAAVSMAACGEKETGREEIGAMDYILGVKDSFHSYNEKYQSYETFGDLRVGLLYEEKYTYMEEHSYIPEGSESGEVASIELETNYVNRIETIYEIKRIDGELFVTIDSYEMNEYCYYRESSSTVMSLRSSKNVEETEVPSNFVKITDKYEYANRVVFGVENGVYYLKVTANEKGENIDEGYFSSWDNQRKMYTVFEDREAYAAEVENILEKIDDDVTDEAYNFLEGEFLTENAKSIAYSKDGGKYVMDVDISNPYFDSMALTMHIESMKGEFSYGEQGVDKVYFKRVMAAEEHVENTIDIQYEYASSIVPETNALKGYSRENYLDAMDYISGLPE